MKIEEKIEKVAEYMQRIAVSQGRDWLSPTEIGNAVGGISSTGVPRHSSWATPVLHKMTGTGMAERNNRGHYRLTTIIM